MGVKEQKARLPRGPESESGLANATGQGGCLKGPRQALGKVDPVAYRKGRGTGFCAVEGPRSRTNSGVGIPVGARSVLSPVE